MVAARMLDVGFSITLHGSDLLVSADYLDCKLQNCQFCVTISEFNRNYILDHYAIAPDKVAVHRVGIDLNRWPPVRAQASSMFTLVSAGRLHPIKNQAFLVLACNSLRNAGVHFRCLIAGEGGEREKLQSLIDEFGLGEEVHLLGHASGVQLARLYSEADVVVLTSRSEGIPVTLMEAMSMERVVLAPAITGIPELVTSGETGLLYQPGSMDDFLAKLMAIKSAGSGRGVGGKYSGIETYYEETGKRLARNGHEITAYCRSHFTPSTGRAVVASDLGSRRELIEGGKTGLLYRVNDVKQLTSAIASLQHNPDLSRRMGEAGSELVRERHSQPKHLEKLENLYEELRRGNSRRRTSITAKPLRVAYIGGRGVGGKYSGIETYYEETGKRLARNGHEITAYCRSHFTPSTAVHEGIRTVRLPTSRFK